MVRASASGVVDLGLIPSRVKLMTSNLVFTVSLIDAQYLRDNVENKSAGLLAVSLGKALSGILSSWCSRQIIDRKLLSEFATGP